MDQLKLLNKGILKNIRSHFQSFKSLLRRIIVYRLILPSVSKICFITIETHQSALIDQSKPLRWFPIVFMNFRKSVAERIFLMINWVIKREFHKIQFREYLFHRYPHIRIHSIIVIDVQESSRFEVHSEIFSFLIIKHNISVPGHMYERKIEQL